MRVEIRRDLGGLGGAKRGIVERRGLLEHDAPAADHVVGDPGAVCAERAGRLDLRPLSQLEPALDDLAEHRAVAGRDGHVRPGLHRLVDRCLKLEAPAVQRAGERLDRRFQLTTDVVMWLLHGGQLGFVVMAQTATTYAAIRMKVSAMLMRVIRLGPSGLLRIRRAASPESTVAMMISSRPKSEVM